MPPLGMNDPTATLLTVLKPFTVVTTATELRHPDGTFDGTVKITPFTPGYPSDPT